jgi:uncharacterized membrane protein YidH (DUF202 family)
MVTQIEFFQVLCWIAGTLCVGGLIFLVLAFVGYFRVKNDCEQWIVLHALDRLESSSTREPVERLLVLSLIVIGVIQLALGIWLGLVLYLV